MSNTLGIHWIATTHGTWLHGDVRGSWRNGKLVGPDPFHADAIRKRMKHDAVVLSPAEVICVGSNIGQTIMEQGHRVFTATLHPTHLHIIFAPLSEDVGITIARLKRRSAELVLRVRRNRGDDRKHLWTRGRFPVFIFTEDHLHNAIEYVRQHNIRVGLPPDPYDWINPLFPPPNADQHGRSI